jgi:50S ribosomal subunit-associated GTPase HflX
MAAVGYGKKKHHRKATGLVKSVKKAVKALGRMGVPAGMRGMGHKKKHHTRRHHMRK